MRFASQQKVTGEIIDDRPGRINGKFSNPLTRLARLDYLRGDRQQAGAASTKAQRPSREGKRWRWPSPAARMTSPTSRRRRISICPRPSTASAVPTAASYPVAVRYCPFEDKVINPSAGAVPLAVSRRFEPVTAVGIGIDCTNVPDVVYSSRKTAVAPSVRAALPSPTRPPGILRLRKARGLRRRALEWA